MILVDISGSDCLQQPYLLLALVEIEIFISPIFLVVIPIEFNSLIHSKYNFCNFSLYFRVTAFKFQYL